MGNIFWSIFIFLMLTAQHVLAQDGQIHFLRGFLTGQYTVIGRQCNSDSTYSGSITVLGNPDAEADSKKPGAESLNSIRILRTVNGQNIEAEGRIESATADNIKVLRIRFTQNGRLYEGTFLIGSDLDNYARLSGYIYLKNGKTKQPGLEAWFIKPKSQLLK